MSDFLDTTLFDLDNAVAAADALSPIALAAAAQTTISMHAADRDVTRHVLHGVEIPVTFSGIY